MNRSIGVSSIILDPRRYAGIYKMITVESTRAAIFVFCCSILCTMTTRKRSVVTMVTDVLFIRTVKHIRACALSDSDVTLYKWFACCCLKEIQGNTNMMIEDLCPVQ